jgi:transposase InsO family protein
MTFLDNATCHAWIYFLHRKEHAEKCIKDFVRKRERQTGRKIQCFWNDGGGEYVNKNIEKFYSENGIDHIIVPPYHHETNGIGERYNRTLITIAHSMMKENDKFLWAETIATAVYLRNRLPHRRIKMTPHEIYIGNKPSIKHLQPWGRECYIHIPEETRSPGTKLSYRGLQGKIVGYTRSQHIYRIWIPSRHKIIETR